MKKQSRTQSIILITAATAVTVLLTLLSGLSSAPQVNWDSWGRHEKQYEELTAALTAGRLSLTEEPAAFLAEMDNPYDPVARSIASAEAGSYALIDTAYYEGKYYTYFGLTPALLLYLPYRMITGKLLPTWFAVILVSLLSIPAGLFFLEALRRRYFPAASALLTALLIPLLAGGLGIPYLAAFCTTYSMPAVLGLVLMLMGLGCFLVAERPSGTFRKPVLLIGSILLSLTIGCRPSFAVSFFLLFPIYGNAIRRGDFFRRKKPALTNTVIILLPALLLGSGFLIYNALRFHDPLEFGFHYLLTTSDMRHSRLSIPASLESSRLLLLARPVLSTHFPFMVINDYIGQFADSLYVEPMFGGLLPLHPFLPAGLLALLPALLLNLTGRKKTEHHPFLLALCSLGAALAVLITDACIAGVSQRYESDFALFVFIPAAIAVLFLGARFHEKRIPMILLAIALILLLAAEVFLDFASICCDGRYFAMRDCNPDIYNKIAHFF